MCQPEREMIMPYLFMRTRFAVALLSSLLISACDVQATLPAADATPEKLALASAAPGPAERAEDWRLVPAGNPATGDRVAADGNGLWLLDADGASLAHLPGQYETLDLKPLADGLLLATVDTATAQPMLVHLDQGLLFGQPLRLPASDFRVESLCLYRDDGRNLFVFLLGEEGLGEQWLVASEQGLLGQAQRVRRLSMPPQAEHCAVDDAQQTLFVSEENVGVWAYGAHPEADLLRRPVDLVAPFGAIARSVAGIAAVPGGLLVLDAQAAQLHAYRETADGWQLQRTEALEGLEEPEDISARTVSGGLELLLVNDGDTLLHRGRFAWQPEQAPVAEPLPVLQSLVQTDPVPSVGDAADDPAIWLHRADPAQSLILGTDKRSGLGVYDLQGREVQFLPVGRLNNVDLRSGFILGERRVDLAVASNRDANSLHLFSVDPDTGHVAELGQVATPLSEIYGLCMSQSPEGTLYAIANDKDGRFLQYQLGAGENGVTGELVREFRVASQPEGCVSDDLRQRLFIGEEGAAVWTLAAGAEAATDMQQVIGVGGPVAADIEGLGFFQHATSPYLVISSQGNDSYVILDGVAPYAQRGAFRIGLNAQRGIDGVSETDGLEVTSTNLGGAWSQGLLVVQDGRKRMPENNQNYKLVPWQAIADALDLD